MSNATKVKDLRAGQTFLYNGRKFLVKQPCWPGARIARYRSAYIVTMEPSIHPLVGHTPAGTPTSFNCNTKVELL